jgi:hypothetical protein
VKAIPYQKYDSISDAVTLDVDSLNDTIVKPMIGVLPEFDYAYSLLENDTIESDTTINTIDTLSNLSYQADRFMIGVRGGFASTMAQPSLLPLGYSVLFDLQYAHYWASANGRMCLGLLTGLSAGYMSTTRNQKWDETFVASTSDGDVKYHVTADNIQENTNQINLEIPIMFSMITSGGFFVNVGPRISMPVYTPYKQIIVNGNIVATDIETSVVVPNNPIYGNLTEELINTSGLGKQQFKLAVLLGLELGYEFKLKSGNSIGLGVYANYGLYNMYNNNPLGAVIAVTAPEGDNLGAVHVESLTNAYTNKLGHLDAGVKLTYNIDWIK